MTVGTANPPLGNVAHKDVHFITLTLPGWGLSSPRPSGVPFHTIVRRDTPAPKAPPSRHAGGSYGSIPTQVIYGSSLDEFPQRDRIVRVLVLACLVALYKVPDYGEHMTMSTYLSFGPMAYNSPFKILLRIAAWSIRTHVSTPEKGTAFIEGFIFDKILWASTSTKAFKRHTQSTAPSFFFLEKPQTSYIRNYCRFSDTSIAVNADCGLRDDIFRSPTDSTQHYPGFAPVLIVAATGDDMRPYVFAEKNVAATTTESC
ncbi:hypothetical protein DL96DRAFT_1824410 [Flagelloscypha sp. PMI_526]|nr:hypothetical protein DL96DRAFT_1824410 [Flagelloscypha sp. PMI_526]